MLWDIAHGFVDLIYPRCCILCKIPLTPESFHFQLCPICQGRITKNKPPFCRKCSRPLKDERKDICKTCLKYHHYFDKAFSSCLYDQTLQKLLHSFKYGNKVALRHLFSHLIYDFINRHNLSFKHINLIIPIPLHNTRRRERGYNQAQLIGKELSQNLSIPLSNNILKRSRHTRNQAVVSVKERWTNIQGAFKIEHSKELKNANILLIDDLLTTGSTASAAALALKSAGVSNVEIVTLSIAEFY